VLPSLHPLYRSPILAFYYFASALPTTSRTIGAAARSKSRLARLALKNAARHHEARSGGRPVSPDSGRARSSSRATPGTFCRLPARCHKSLLTPTWDELMHIALSAMPVVRHFLDVHGERRSTCRPLTRIFTARRFQDHQPHPGLPKRFRMPRTASTFPLDAPGAGLARASAGPQDARQASPELLSCCTSSRRARRLLRERAIPSDRSRFPFLPPSASRSRSSTGSPTRWCASLMVARSLADRSISNSLILLGVGISEFFHGLWAPSRGPRRRVAVQPRRVSGQAVPCMILPADDASKRRVVQLVRHGDGILPRRSR